MDDGKSGDKAVTNVSPANLRNPTVESINKFARISKFLEDQLSECHGRIKQNSSKNLDTTVPLEEDISVQKTNVIESQAKVTLQDDVVKAFLYGQQIMESFQTELLSIVKEDDTALYHTLNATMMSKLEILDKLSRQISTISENIKTTRQSSIQLSLELYKAVQRNKKNLENLHESMEKLSVPNNCCKLEDDYPYVKKERERLEFEITKLRQVKHIFQSLIHASKVDWYEDKELCDMMVKLGE